MRNLALFTGSALVLSFAFAAGAEDKAASPPATPPAPAAASPATSAPAPSAPTDLSTPEPAAAAPASAASGSGIDDLEKQLADNQDKLTTALHSYELLNEENQRLKSEADKSAADNAALAAQVEELKKSVAYYQAQTVIVGQVDSLRTQLRQTQNEVAALASENADFRTRLALSGPPPTALLAVPTRPGAAPPPPALAPAVPAPSAPALPSPAADKAAAPRTHVVVAGDSLSKISKEYYGTASRYGEILGANRSIIHNENILPLGAKLIIP